MKQGLAVWWSSGPSLALMAAVGQLRVCKFSELVMLDQEILRDI